MTMFLAVLPVLLSVLVVSAQVADTGFAPTPESICPLVPGTKAPNAPLRQANGDVIALSEALAGRPTVLIFYRGGW